MITVIDSIMGSGKTSWAIQHVNEADYCNDRFLYITPFLDEVKRIMDKTDVDFFQPQNRGKGKLNNINIHRNQDRIWCKRYMGNKHFW